MRFLEVVHIVMEGKHEFLNSLGKRSGVKLEDAQARFVLGCTRLLVLLDGKRFVFL